MGTIYVKTMSELVQANQRFKKRVREIQSIALREGSKANLIRSQQMTEQVKFKGTLVSGLTNPRVNELHYEVISSAPHSLAIEEGIAPQGETFIGFKGNWITFEEMPKLESWVTEKLMKFDSAKAQFFLNRKAVKVGDKGFPYLYPNGVHFMQIGAEEGAQIVNLELENGVRSI